MLGALTASKIAVLLLVAAIVIVAMRIKRGGPDAS